MDATSVSTATGGFKMGNVLEAKKEKANALIIPKQVMILLLKINLAAQNGSTECMVLLGEINGSLIPRPRAQMV
jgi:hypothetical protein